MPRRARVVVIVARAADHSFSFSFSFSSAFSSAFSSSEPSADSRLRMAA
jgi:hypothetical protein